VSDAPALVRLVAAPSADMLARILALAFHRHAVVEHP
jgi:hypothetical protein